jgi:hypothetical protein
MYDLAEMYEYVHKMEIYELGVAVALGFNNPKEIQNLMPAQPPIQFDMEALPAMLRIPKQRA